MLYKYKWSNKEPLLVEKRGVWTQYWLWTRRHVGYLIIDCLNYYDYVGIIILLTSEGFVLSLLVLFSHSQSEYFFIIINYIGEEEGKKKKDIFFNK